MDGFASPDHLQFALEECEKWSTAQITALMVNYLKFPHGLFKDRCTRHNQA